MILSGCVFACRMTNFLWKSDRVETCSTWPILSPDIEMLFFESTNVPRDPSKWNFDNEKSRTLSDPSGIGILLYLHDRFLLHFPVHQSQWKHSYLPLRKLWQCKFLLACKIATISSRITLLFCIKTLSLS